MYLSKLQILINMKRIISMILLCAVVALASCNDNKGTTTNPDPDPVPAKKYDIGDLYPDSQSPVGVVYWVQQSDSTKGLIVSLDQTTGLAWDEAFNWKSTNTLPSGMSWRLATKDELQYLYCAYAGTEPTTWDYGSSPNKPDLDKASKFRTALSSSGTDFMNEFYWSSTEEAGDVLVVGFSSGTTGYLFKIAADSMVRCVASFE